MSTLQIDQADVSQLDVFDNTHDLRRDLHIFVNYVHEREVKRAYRTNDIPKADSKRLAKLMNDEAGLEEIAEHNFSNWVDYVSDFALDLGLVDYDTEGVYAGYTSQSPSFPDNYIIVQNVAYDKFIKNSLANQERQIQEALLKGGRNEFLNSPILGRLSCFSNWGAAYGVLPLLDLAQARNFLLKELAKFESGVWYRTTSLVAYFKKNHPYFLISKKPKYKPMRGKKATRYGNFSESKDSWVHYHNSTTIPDNAPDGFERVEGRYIERFLEGLPLLLGYVDVAYSPDEYEGLYPHQDYLQAFRINDLLYQVIQRQIPEPRVTVQPNYEVHVESLLYPSQMLDKLGKLGDVVSTGTVTVLKLDKRKVTEQVVIDETLDVVQLLTDLSDRPLPQNIRMELEEWAGQSDKFLLYDGFGILETNQKRLPVAESYTVEMIDERIRLIKSPHALYEALEAAERFPLQIRHKDDEFKILPTQAKTIFRTQKEVKAKPKSKTKTELTLKRRTLTTLHFPDSETRDVFLRALAAARCPVESEVELVALTYDQRHETEVETVLKELSKEYKINFEAM